MKAIITRRNTVILVLGTLLIVSIAGNVFLWDNSQNQADAPADEAAAIITQLEKATDLPDEQPALITVVDKTKLSDATLARDSQNGDKLLVYQKAGKVVVYRPSSKKLVNILSITAAAPVTSTTNPSPSPTTQR